MQSLLQSEAVSPVAKSVLVGIFGTAGAVVESDWKILAVSVALQLGMAAITALATNRRSPSRAVPRRKPKAIHALETQPKK